MPSLPNFPPTPKKQTLNASRIFSVTSGCVAALIFVLGIILLENSLQWWHEICLLGATFFLTLGSYSQLEYFQDLTLETEDQSREAEDQRAEHIIEAVLAGIAPNLRTTLVGRCFRPTYPAAGSSMGNDCLCVYQEKAADEPPVA